MNDKDLTLFETMGVLQSQESYIENLRSERAGLEYSLRVHDEQVRQAQETLQSIQQQVDELKHEMVQDFMGRQETKSNG